MMQISVVNKIFGFIFSPSGRAYLLDKSILPLSLLSSLIIIYILIDFLLFFRAGLDVAADAEPRPASFNLDQSVRTITSLQLFGSDRANPSARISPQITKTRLHLELMGIISHVGGKASSAIIKVRDRNTDIYRIGDQVTEGVQLSAVHKDYVLLEKSGILEKLNFPILAKATSGITKAQVKPALAQAIVKTAKLPINLASLADQIPSLMEKLNVDADGFYTSQNAESTGRWLGLQKGDQILAVNDQPFSNLINNPIALVAVVASGKVRLSIRRGSGDIVITTALP